MVELILIMHVFQKHNIYCVQGDIATVPAQMKKVLANQIEIFL